MPSYLANLENQALRLPPRDRGILVAALRESLDNVPANDFAGAPVDKTEENYQAWRAASKGGAVSRKKPAKQLEPAKFWPEAKPARSK